MPLNLDMIQHLAALFHIQKEAMGHPKLKAIADEAMKELEAHAEGLLPKPEPEPEPEFGNTGIVPPTDDDPSRRTA